MASKTLSGPPRLTPLFARSAASMIPGASLLPFVPGRGRDVPELELRLDEVRADRERVAAYAKVCGFPLRTHLPITYPHVLAFPLQMAVMADGSFPFGAVGLVHVENAIVQRAQIPIGEPLSIRVRPTGLSKHRRGRTFTLVTEVSAGGEVVWEGYSTMLRRGGGGGSEGAGGEAASSGGGSEAEGADEHGPVAGGASRPGGDELDATTDADDLRVGATWRLPGDLGRRYAAVSGDSNPIHMHPLSAKLFGFPGAIAHGMWSKARCLAALESRTPVGCEARVRFRKPIVLPARVDFASTAPKEGTWAAEAGTGSVGTAGGVPGAGAAGAGAAGAGAAGAGVPGAGAAGERIEFALTNAKKGTAHLDGVIAPLERNEERSEAR